MSFSKVLLWSESTLSQIWTCLAKSILYDSNHHVRGAFNKFPYFFVQAFKIFVDSWKLSMLLLYILWDDWSIFMISGSNKQLQQELEYTLLKSDRHS